MYLASLPVLTISKGYLQMATSDTTTNPQYVYFIGNENTVKIGYSNNPQKRLSQLQSGNPQRIEVLATIEDDNPQSLESNLHSIFREHKLSGEWFKNSDSVAFVVKYLMFSMERRSIEDLEYALYLFDAVSKQPCFNHDWPNGFSEIASTIEDKRLSHSALELMQSDLFTSGESVNAATLSDAFNHYRECLKQFKLTRHIFSKRIFHGQDERDWHIITYSGEVVPCTNFFSSHLLQESRDKHASETIPVQMSFDLVPCIW